MSVWHGDRGELGDGRELSGESGGVQRSSATAGQPRRTKAGQHPWTGGTHGLVRDEGNYGEHGSYPSDRRWYDPALTRCLAAQLQPARHLTSLVVDLSAVSYIGVRGFAALSTAATNAQRHDVAFCVAACSPPALRLLAVIDPDHTLTVRADSGRAGRPGSSGLRPNPAPLGEIRSLREKR